MALPAVPFNPAWPAVAVCLVAGLLTIIFRRAAQTILCGAVLAGALTLAAHLLSGRPAAQYVIAALSNNRLLTVTAVPDVIHSPWLLGLAAAGLLGGVIFALLRPDFALRVTMALDGGLALVAGLTLVSAEFFSRQLPLGYPMNYCQVGVVAWLGLAALGVLAQQATDKSDRAADPN